jgi:Protein of unknown function (DUF3301)
MQLNVGLLMLMVAAAVVVWGWRQALQSREIANDAAMEACERLGLQFLDGTSAFGTWRWQREAKRLRLHRVYVFDYTTKSTERRQGFVVLSHGRVESVGFAQDEQRASPQSITYAPIVNVTMTYSAPNNVPKLPSAIDKTSDSASRESSSNVQDLAEWRRTRRPGEPLH